MSDTFEKLMNGVDSGAGFASGFGQKKIALMQS
jgi:hypothetical protein